MVVAGQDHRVARLDRVQRLGHAVARGGEAIPGVGPVAGLAIGVLEPQTGHDQVLAQDVPARLGARQAVVQPALLLEAQEGARRVQAVQALGVGDDLALGAALVDAGPARAILASVQHEELGQIAIADALVNRHLQAAIQAGATDRHGLVEGLIAGGAAAQEIVGPAALVGPDAGIVVQHLMIVPDHQTGRRRVQALQVRVGPVQRIAVAIAGQGGGVLEPVRPHDIGRPRPGAGVFVDVVA